MYRFTQKTIPLFVQSTLFENTHWVYRLVYPSVRTICEGLLQRETYGLEFVSQKAPFLFVGNHVSFLDPPAFATAIPQKTFFFARKTLFKSKFWDWLLRGVNVLPIDREKVDIGGFKQMVQFLKEGSGVFLFPEGTRSPDGRLQVPKSGVGMLACYTQVPVIPGRIFGSYEMLGRHRMFPDLLHPLSIVFGPPLVPADYDPGEAHPKRYEEAARRIMQAIADLQLPRIPVV